MMTPEEGALEDAEQPALDGLEPPAEPEQLALELSPENADHGRAAAAALDQPLPASRELLEKVSDRWLELTDDDGTAPLELLDQSTIALSEFWAIVYQVCVCYSCDGQCGGSGHPGWCGHVELVDGRPICATCLADADVFDSNRVGISVRVVDDDHVALVIDPWQTFRKVTARLTPREARHLAELLNARAAELEVETRPLMGLTRAELEQACQAGDPVALAEWKARDR